MLSKADRLEDTDGSMRVRQIKNLRFGMPSKPPPIIGDNTALVTVSMAPQDFGTIVRVSAAACRMFGLAKSAFEGSNVRQIIPSPIKKYHDQLMSRFRRKRSSRIMNQQRLMFAQHSDGALFPI